MWLNLRCAPITAGPDAPDGVPWKDPTRACEGNEVGSLL